MHVHAGRAAALPDLPTVLMGGAVAELADADLTEALAEQVRRAAASRTPLRIVGGGHQGVLRAAGPGRRAADVWRAIAGSSPTIRASW